LLADCWQYFANPQAHAWLYRYHVDWDDKVG
jgi:hypothetical protein